MVQHSQHIASNIPTREAFDMNKGALVNRIGDVGDPALDAVNEEQYTPPPSPNPFDLNALRQEGALASGNIKGIEGTQFEDNTTNKQPKAEKDRNKKTAQALQHLATQQQLDTLNLELSDVREEIKFYKERLVEISHQKVEVQHTITDTENTIETTEKKLKQNQEDLNAEQEALPEKEKTVKEAERQLEIRKNNTHQADLNVMRAVDGESMDKALKQKEEAEEAEATAELNLEEKKEIVLNSQMKIEILEQEIKEQQETLKEEHEKLNELKEELTALEKEEEFTRAEKLPELEALEADIVAKIDKLEQELEQTNILRDDFEKNYNTNEEFRSRVDSNDYTVQNFIEENLTKDQQVHAHNKISDFSQSEKWPEFYQDHILRQAQQSDIGRNEHNDIQVQLGHKEASGPIEHSPVDWDNFDKATETSSPTDTTNEVDNDDIVANGVIPRPIDTTNHFGNAAIGLTPAQQSPAQPAIEQSASAALAQRESNLATLIR